MQRIYKFNNAIVYIVLVFLLFDGMRANLKIGAYLTYVRECAIFYLIIYSFCQFPFNRNLYTKSLLFFLLYHTFIVLLSITNPGPIMWAFVIKPYEFLGAICVFSNYYNLTHKDISCLVDQIITITIVFSILNVVLYFIPLPIWNKDEFWWGRISCGYPTMDVITQSYSLLLLLFSPFQSLSNRKRIVYTIIILTGIMLSFSGTGTFLLLLIISSKVLFDFQNKKKNLAFLFISLLFISTFLLPFLKETFQKEYEMGTFLLENKWQSLIGVDNEEGNTLQMRVEQLENAREKQNDVISKVFGTGLNYATNEVNFLEKYNDSIFIENEYSLLSICYGYFGLFLYLCFIINLYFYCLYKIKARKKMVFSVLGISIFVCNNYTLLPLVLFSNYIGFAMIYTIIRKDLQKPFLVISVRKGFRYFSKD